MKYFLRSIKYFCACCVFAVVLIAGLMLCGWSRYGFDDGAELAGQFAVMALLFALLAALYPKLCFTRRRVAGDLSEQGVRIVRNAFRAAGYEPAGEQAGVWRFRCKGFGRRLRRLFDDEIAVTQQPGWLTLEGHRTEVFRVLQHWDATATGETNDQNERQG